ncbi:YbaY family lipoprotein [Thalassotalea sp. ND16A]|uniref:YbaY family lipoprotein n=1 Tax=Thalassotalea sp. ND16A TaxID=1535422 RepID=UPI00051A8B99|nr:YbaY family lipoprotein [Thalassotalea sp. ND16A]KGK00380.1 hypothetical protein ND16A_3587 [Thalassotalea sp. ND16A]
MKLTMQISYFLCLLIFLTSCGGDDSETPNEPIDDKPVLESNEFCESTDGTDKVWGTIDSYDHIEVTKGDYIHIEINDVTIQDIIYPNVSTRCILIKGEETFPINFKTFFNKQDIDSTSTYKVYVRYYKLNTEGSYELTHWLNEAVFVLTKGNDDFADIVIERVD